MELRHLRYFTTVAAERSFRRAADKLHVSQPPLSRQIQQLEDELGVRLLDRGRPITLTAPGRYLFEHAQQILLRVEEMRAMTRRLGKQKVARLGVGFVASTLYDALPEVIRRFRITSPDVEISFVEMTTAEQIAALRRRVLYPEFRHRRVVIAQFLQLHTQRFRNPRNAVVCQRPRREHCPCLIAEPHSGIRHRIGKEIARLLDQQTKHKQQKKNLKKTQH